MAPRRITNYTPNAIASNARHRPISAGRPAGASDFAVISATNEFNFCRDEIAAPDAGRYLHWGPRSVLSALCQQYQLPTWQKAPANRRLSTRTVGAWYGSSDEIVAASSVVHGGRGYAKLGADLGAQPPRLRAGSLRLSQGSRISRPLAPIPPQHQSRSEPDHARALRLISNDGAGRGRPKSTGAHSPNVESHRWQNGSQSPRQ
jgi:hypothetical protein